MLWIKAFHIIAMVTWFAGLFYLPRLFVYHADATDAISRERFKIMEWRLYYAITTPGGLLTTALGLWLLFYNSVSYHYYLTQGWMHAKLALVALLWGYHIHCGYLLRDFQQDANQRSSKYYRFYNELPTIVLIFVVILVVVRPF